MANRIIWWVLLLAWIGGCAYWHVCKIKQLCNGPSAPTIVVSDPPEPESMPLRISDGATLRLVSRGNFSFVKSRAEVNFDAVKVEIDSLAKFVAANPGKSVTITGYYSPEETNYSSYPNLGLARATGVKNYLTSFCLPDSVISIDAYADRAIIFNSNAILGGIAIKFNK